jgi:hypothetical protein
MTLDRMRGKTGSTADERPIGVVADVLHPVDTSDQAKHGGEYYLVVESAAGRTPPVYVPEQAVRAVEPDRVIRGTATDEIVRSGWNDPSSAFRYR